MNISSRNDFRDLSNYNGDLERKRNRLEFAFHQTTLFPQGIIPIFPMRQKMIISPDIEEQFSPERISKILDQGPEDQVHALFQEILLIASENMNFIITIFKEEYLQSKIYNFITKITNSDIFRDYFQILLNVIQLNPTRAVDPDFLLLTRDCFPNFPYEILKLYSEISSISSLCQAAIFCLGIVSDVIEYCQHFDHGIQLSAAHTLLAIFSSKYRKFDLLDIIVLLPSLINLLTFSTEPEYINTILNVLIIISENSSCVTAKQEDIVFHLFDLNLTEIIIKIAFSSPQNSEKCFALAAAMCEHGPPYISSRFLETEVFKAIHKIFIVDYPPAAEAMHFLAAAINSNPEAIHPFIPLKLVEAASNLIPGTYQMIRCGALFGAALMNNYEEMVKVVAKNSIGEAMVEMLDSGLTHDIETCLKGFRRALFVGSKDPETFRAISSLVCSEEINDMLNQLLQKGEQSSTFSSARNLFIEIQEID